MEVKFIAFWGWTNSERPHDTPEEAIARVPPGSGYAIEMYHADVTLPSGYGLPDQPRIDGYRIIGVKPKDS